MAFKLKKNYIIEGTRDHKASMAKQVVMEQTDRSKELAGTGNETTPSAETKSEEITTKKTSKVKDVISNLGEKIKTIGKEAAGETLEVDAQSKGRDELLAAAAERRSARKAKKAEKKAAKAEKALAEGKTKKAARKTKKAEKKLAKSKDGKVGGVTLGLKAPGVSPAKKTDLGITDEPRVAASELTRGKASRKYRKAEKAEQQARDAAHYGNERKAKRKAKKAARKLRKAKKARTDTERIIMDDF